MTYNSQLERIKHCWYECKGKIDGCHYYATTGKTDVCVWYETLLYDEIKIYRGLKNITFGELEQILEDKKK